MALQMFMAIHNRDPPAHSSDTLASLLAELRAFLKTVAVPGRDFVMEEKRNINLLVQSEEQMSSSFDVREATANRADHTSKP